ncbi:hypothetical protein [Streptomyces sp. NPDC001828]|uniref:ATP-binding protein n=1 Tax=Streptomyces sp. NPDC001828 TaxID=3364615 RepID=UPI0036773319
MYRTVQECLTNIREHAPGATASVDADTTHLRVTVRNTPARTPPATPLPGSRQGLIGLGERATPLNGTVTSGPSPDGGFTVRLTLPDRPGEPNRLCLPARQPLMTMSHVAARSGACYVWQVDCPS